MERRQDVPLQRQETPKPEVVLPFVQAFELKNAGEDASTPLRYAASPGAVSHLTSTKVTARRLAGGTWGASAAIPAVTNGVAFSVVAGAPLAGRVLAGTVDGDAAAAASYLADWKPLEDRRFTLDIDQRGRLGALAFSDDPGSQRSVAGVDAIKQRLLLTVVPVPDEPVGVGATWRVVTVLRQHPFVVKQTALYTLTARSETSWKITAAIQRVGEPQVVQDPSIPADTSVELIALVRHYKGTLDIDPRAVIGTGKLAVDSSMHLRISERTKGASEEILEDTGAITLSRATP